MTKLREYEVEVRTNCEYVFTTKVKAKIFDDPMLKVFQISVESYKGVVQLSGFVDSKQAANKATQVAKSVDGVESVKNSLVVK